MDAIDSVVIVWRARFDAEDQVLALPQIDAFGNWPRSTRVDRKFQKRSQSDRSKHIDVAVHISGVYCDQQISRCSNKRVKVIGETRITEVACRNRGGDFVGAHW